ncbi:molecular chaperone HscC [Candidatus Epulonipiscium fishelsonii]|nr:molecular chaperone HscC [Epulopiscium sp. SCG-B05WGA-EpuloA1]
MIIGIDLGTTNSLVAYYSEEGAKIIPNRLSKHLTPSVVSIDKDDTIYVGEIAKERLLLYPNETVTVFKRDMGSGRKFALGNKEFTAEELSSFVIKSLKEDAEKFLGQEITEAVISVPAYFNDIRRKATQKAGELAGLKVERIISEPTASAIAYQLNEKEQSSKSIVFDLGGGTFDVSILEFFDNILEVRAVAGDNFLGGEDFTQVLYDMFLKHHKLEEKNLDHKTVLLIYEQAEKTKIKFNSEKRVEMVCTVNEEKLTYTISIDTYEKACEELFEKIRKPIKRSLSDANLRLSDIENVIMIGGATKLPIIYKFVSKLFKRIPYTHINPDEAVALGTAIQAAMKERRKDVKEVILTDVCPFTLGTEVVKQTGEEQYESGYFCPIIERNTIIPASRTERVYTVNNNQTELRIDVLQGEHRFAKFNLLLGEMLIEVPKNKAGAEAVDITYTYDINSILEVQATVVSTNKVYSQIIKGQSIDMDDEAIAQRLKELAYLKIPPREQEANKLIITKAERLYSESIGEVRRRIEHELLKFDIALNSQDKNKIDAARIILEEVVEYFREGY